MKKSLKDMLLYEETLFKNPEVFDPDYIPPDLDHRESQFEGMAACIRPGIRGARPFNARILGPPATGKTTAVKKLFEKLEEETERIMPVHVNCQIHASKFAVFSQIHKKVVGHLPPETGVPFSKVYEAIFKKLVRSGKALVVALDDMNYLFYKRHANEVMYDLLRAHEVIPGAKSAVFGIVSDTDFRYKLDPKVASVYNPREIFFRPYKRGEMFDILNKRAQLGLYPGVIAEEGVERVVEHAFSGGDLRLGIELLRSSAMAAEEDSSRKVESDHIERAFENSRAASLGHLLEPLGEDERTLLKTLAELGGEAESGALYDTYKTSSKVSYTTFYRILDKLEGLRLLETGFSGKGKRGRTRRIVLRHDPEEIKPLVEKRS